MKTNEEPKFHNPDKLESPGDGWRFLVEGEEPQHTVDDYWNRTVQQWCSWFGQIINATFRTRRPLPQPKSGEAGLRAKRPWNEAYHYELEHSEQIAKDCEKEGDTHGKCFHEGRASGIINIDIMACQIFDALDKEIAQLRASHAQLLDALEEAMPYLQMLFDGKKPLAAYADVFPHVIAKARAALTAAKGQPEEGKTI